MIRKRVSVIIIALLLTIGGICLAHEIIPWDIADAYYGQFVTVAGTIVTTYNSDKACFLDFHSNEERYFTAVIFRKDLAKFPSNPEEYYKGEKVHVTGFVQRSNGKPEMILDKPSQIEILK